MKKFVSLGLMVLGAFGVMGQSGQVGTSPIYYKDGKVGIGVTPSQKLHVNGSVQFDLPVKYSPSKSFSIFAEGNDHIIQGQAWTGTGQSNVKSRIRFSQRGLELQIPESFTSFETATTFSTGIFLSSGYHGSLKGNVGIGTQTPNAKLDVAGNIHANRLSLISWWNSNVGHTHSSIVMNGTRVNDQWKLYNDGARSSIGMITTDIFSNIRFVSHHDEQMKNGKTMSDEELINNNTKMIINYLGNVGIGTTTPDYKLDVCGTVRAKEVKVEEFTCSNASFNGTLAANQITVTTNGHTADFVFEEDYQLRELSEVENFIKTNKHLPDIPSAAAMEEKGVNLAEMNKLLLLKIEELTLYSIEQKKANEKLEERLAKIEALLLAK